MLGLLAGLQELGEALEQKIRFFGVGGGAAFRDGDFEEAKAGRVEEFHRQVGRKALVVRTQASVAHAILGLKRQSKSARLSRSSNPDCLNRRSVKRERRRSSSSCSMAPKVSS